jgi:hypothetical protein
VQGEYVNSKLPLVLITLAVLITPAVAQTYRSPATPPAPLNCSPTGIYCYGTPFYLNGDLSQPESTPWIDVNYQLGTGFIAFAAGYGQGPLAQYGTQYVDPGTLTYTMASFTSNGRTGMLVSSVSFSFGNGLGTFAGTFGHYYAAQGSGKGGGGGGWKTNITGGVIVIGPASASKPITDSPIAPTPVCLPGPNCPPHDLGQ